MTTHDPALQWAADRANLPYDRFVTGLTPATIARIRAAYTRQNGSTIPLPPVQPTVEADQVSLEAEEHAVVAEQSDVAQSDAEHGAGEKDRLRAAFQANMRTLPPMVSAWQYKRFLEALDATSRAEQKLLEKIVREEIRNVTEPMAIKLNHFLWWLDGQ